MQHISYKKFILFYIKLNTNNLKLVNISKKYLNLQNLVY